MEGPDITGSNELAAWLQEAARRRVACRTSSTPVVAAAPAAQPEQRREPRFLRELLLLSIATLTFLTYLYIDVQLEIYSLRSLIVFIFPGLR